MFIVWTFIAIVSLVSALIIQQEMACGWSYWQVRGVHFFNTLSCFSPGTNFYPQWSWRVGRSQLDLVHNPQGHIRDSIGENYNPPIFKLGNFYIVIWS